MGAESGSRPSTLLTSGCHRIRHASRITWKANKSPACATDRPERKAISAGVIARARRQYHASCWANGIAVTFPRMLQPYSRSSLLRRVGRADRSSSSDYCVPGELDMCGIVGFVCARGASPPDRGGLHDAVAALAHRGPDQSGTYEAEGVGLGFTRLSIIDLDGGGQPMKNEDGSVVAVYNGEIWNHNALRDDLTRCGHRFSSRSDTEVLVHGYEEWGADLTQHLDGMFAFAIWDVRSEVLLLARDRFGKKPLYIQQNENGVAFGSDARSVFLVTGERPQIDETMVAEYLFQRYVVSPQTLFAGVNRLPPAHRAVYDRSHVAHLSVLAGRRRRGDARAGTGRTSRPSVFCHRSTPDERRSHRGSPERRS